MTQKTFNPGETEFDKDRSRMTGAELFENLFLWSRLEH